MSPLRLLAATGAAPSTPRGSASPESGRFPSEYCTVPSLGVAAWWYAPPPSDRVIPIPLDRLVDALRPADVVPQPRYPDEVSSLGATLPAIMPGRVGSLFGLKPYSSTSLRRSSSAAFFAFRRRQRKIAAKTINATETTGTTTATAMVPPGDRP